MNNIGRKIKRLRKELGLTQEKLARKADISYVTLLKIENSAVKNPTIKTMQSIAEALNVKVDDLIN